MLLGPLYKIKEEVLSSLRQGVPNLGEGHCSSLPPFISSRLPLPCLFPLLLQIQGIGGEREAPVGVLPSWVAMPFAMSPQVLDHPVPLKVVFPSPESQQKEVEEMLEQEGLVDVACSSPSEQVAYLLVERSTLLEKLETLEQKLDSPGCLERLCTAELQVHLGATTSGGLRLSTEHP